MHQLPAVPDFDLIVSGKIVEGSSYDYKQYVDLNSDRGKSKIIDDAVAFLNGGPGYLIIGVIEEGGAYKSFAPLSGDPDAYSRRLLSIFQDNIDPRPLKIEVTHFQLESGFVAVVHIPWHGRRAFQNRVTGGFLLRTGVKNTPLRREEVQALFTSEATFYEDSAALLNRESRRTLERELMQERGPTFHLAVMPGEHYERGRKPFNQDSEVVKGLRHFHDGHGSFEGCEDGSELMQVTLDRFKHISRLFIGDDWGLYLQVEHPFDPGHSSVDLYTFESKLKNYLTRLRKFLEAEGVRGPFCAIAEFKNLSRDQKIAWAFPNVDNISIKATMLSDIDDAEFIHLVSRSAISKSRFR